MKIEFTMCIIMIHPQTWTIYLDTEVSANGARLAVLGVGLAQHDTAGLDGAKSLPHHGDNGGGVHVLHQSRVERPKYYCFFTYQRTLRMDRISGRPYRSH